MSFATFTQKDTDKKVLVNLNNITMILGKTQYSTTQYSTICFEDVNNFVDVKETIEEIKTRLD